MAHLNNLIMTQFYFSTLPHLKYIYCDKSINLLMHHFKCYSYINRNDLAYSTRTFRWICHSLLHALTYIEIEFYVWYFQ